MSTKSKRSRDDDLNYEEKRKKHKSSSRKRDVSSKKDEKKIYREEKDGEKTDRKKIQICTRCGAIGHTKDERICPLLDLTLLPSKMDEDPLTLINKREEALRTMTRFKLEHFGPKLDPSSELNTFIPEPEESEQDLLSCLSKKER